MYSIHSTVKDEAPSQLVEEQPADMICMFDDIPYLDSPPKWDQYEDDHEAEIEVDCSEKSTACHWQEGDHLQFRCDNHPVHNSHDSDEEETENLRDMEVVLNPESQPLTYIDFQILDESLEPEANSELIQNKSVPLCFN